MATDWTINSKYNNCYAYAFDNHNVLSSKKDIPGLDDSIRPYTCKSLVAGILSDHPNASIVNKSDSCPVGFHKVYLAVDDRPKQNDFHFWRQESEGHWTHKLGTQLPSNVDASHQMIHDPELSNKHFDNYQYDTTCAYFCAPTNLSK